jgi:hypothetical protein
MLNVQSHRHGRDVPIGPPRYDDRVDQVTARSLTFRDGSGN